MKRELFHHSCWPPVRETRTALCESDPGARGGCGTPEGPCGRHVHPLGAGEPDGSWDRLLRGGERRGLPAMKSGTSRRRFTTTATRSSTPWSSTRPGGETSEGHQDQVMVFTAKHHHRFSGGGQRYRRPNGAHRSWSV